MRLINGLLTFIASLLVIGLAGTWLANRYEVGMDFGVWSPNYSKIITFRSWDGVPLDGSGDVYISSGNLLPRPWFEEIHDELLLIPVEYDESKNGYLFNGYSRRGDTFISDGGECRANVVNLLLVSKKNPQGIPVFDERVFVVKYLFIQSKESSKIFALTVRVDTNKDKKLDCGDRARFEMIDVQTFKKTKIDRTFIPDELTDVDYEHEEKEFVFTEQRVSEDAASIKIIRLSLDTLEFTETETPDLLSAARDAFNMPASD